MALVCSSARWRASLLLWWTSSPGCSERGGRSSLRVSALCPTPLACQISHRYSRFLLHILIRWMYGVDILAKTMTFLSLCISCGRVVSMCSSSLTITQPVECVCSSWSSLSVSQSLGAMVSVTNTDPVTRSGLFFHVFKGFHAVSCCSPYIMQNVFGCQ